jgi:hypothetical protein
LFYSFEFAHFCCLNTNSKISSYSFFLEWGENETKREREREREREEERERDEEIERGS